MAATTAPPNNASTHAGLSFFDPQVGGWRDLVPDTSGLNPAQADERGKDAKSAAAAIKEFLLSSMQMQHVVLLAGSGTSLGPVKGPSMSNLWDFCTNTNPGTGNDKKTTTTLAANVIKIVHYNEDLEKNNIEVLLSRCEAYLQVQDNDEVTSFVKASKSTILNMCTNFVDRKDDQQLEVTLPPFGGRGPEGAADVSSLCKRVEGTGLCTGPF